MKENYSRSGFFAEVSTVFLILVSVVNLCPGKVEEPSHKVIYKLEELDEAPKPRQSKKEKYSDGIGNSNRNLGWAVVKLTISETGNVIGTYPSIIEKRYGDFTEKEKVIITKVIAAGMSSLKFEPGIKNDLPVATEIEVRYPISADILEPVAGGDVPR